MQNGIPVGLRSNPSFGIARQNQLTAIIQSLFWDGSQGWWYDNQDLTTLFQDSAGTTPVTAVEQSVGLQLDKSKGLVLGPQLFTDFTTEGTWTDNGNGSWSITSAVGTQDLRVDYVGTTNKRYVITVTVSGHSGSQLIIYPLNTGPYNVGNGSFTSRENSNAGFFIIRAPSGASATVSNISVRELPGNHRYQTTSGSRPVWSKRVNRYLSTTTLATQNITTLATNYVLRFSGTGSITLSGTATGAYSAGVHTITCTAGTLTSTVSGTVTDADIRPANQATGLLPLYQRVNTATDYDTNGFPGYLKADGTDDFLQTNSIDFSATDKVTLCAGVRKLSDAAAGTVVDQNGATGTNSFMLRAPAGATATYAFYSGGNVAFGGTAVSPSSYASPITNVLTGVGDISGDSAILRINGTQIASSTSDQGTGNYSNLPVYFFRRQGSAVPFNGEEYANIAVGKLLTADQLTALETYVNGATKAFAT